MEAAPIGRRKRARVALFRIGNEWNRLPAVSDGEGEGHVIVQ